MATGALTVIIWDYIPFAGGMTLTKVTGLYSLALGFPISLICIVIVSLLTKAPSREVTDVFDLAAKREN